MRERWRFFAQLSASCFSPCSCLCLLEGIFKHQLSELMFDGDCRRKFEFLSEPVRAHWPLLWPSNLRLACPGPLRPLHTRTCGQLSRRNKYQVSKKAGAVLRPSLFLVIDRAPQKSMPPIPPMPPPAPPGIAGLCFFGNSATMASVVMSKPATDAAPCSAARTTLVGSMIPLEMRLPYSPACAS